MSYIDDLDVLADWLQEMPESALIADPNEQGHWSFEVPILVMGSAEDAVGFARQHIENTTILDVVQTAAQYDSSPSFQKNYRYRTSRIYWNKRGDGIAGYGPTPIAAVHSLGAHLISAIQHQRQRERRDEGLEGLAGLSGDDTDTLKNEAMVIADWLMSDPEGIAARMVPTTNPATTKDTTPYLHFDPKFEGGGERHIVLAWPWQSSTYGDRWEASYSARGWSWNTNRYRDRWMVVFTTVGRGAAATLPEALRVLGEQIILHAEDSTE